MEKAATLLALIISAASAWYAYRADQIASISVQIAQKALEDSRQTAKNSNLVDKLRALQQGCSDYVTAVGTIRPDKLKDGRVGEDLRPALELFRAPSGRLNNEEKGDELSKAAEKFSGQYGETPSIIAADCEAIGKGVEHRITALLPQPSK